MDLRDILNSLTTLSEATKETGKGRIHKAGPGGYGRKYDTDEEGEEKSEKKPEEKKGRGRPKKDSDDKKYDTDAVGKAFGVGKPPKKPVGKPSKKHTLKDWIEHVETNQQLNEAEQLTIQPAQSNTQLIKQGNKTLGTVTNPQLAQQIKQSIGRGEMTLTGDKLGQEMAEAQLDELSPDTLTRYADKAKGQRGWAFGRAQAGKEGHGSADPQGKFDRLWNKRADGYNQAVAKGARDLDKSGQKSSWNWSKDEWPAALNRNVEEDAVEESGLQAYLGNKKYGKAGMDALRKAGREGASKEKMAQIRAKYDKMDEGIMDTVKGYAKKAGRAIAGEWNPTVYARNHFEDWIDSNPGLASHKEGLMSLYDRAAEYRLGIDNADRGETVLKVYKQIQKGQTDNLPVWATAPATNSRPQGNYQRKLAGVIPVDENETAAAMYALRKGAKLKENPNGDGALRMQGQNMNHPMNEKAVSKAQQKFMGMVHAAQKGKKPASKVVADVAKSMGKKDAKDFAATKHKGLPEKVKKTDEAVSDSSPIGKDVVTSKERLAPHAGMGKGPLQQKLGQAGVMAKNIGRFLKGKSEIPTMENENLDETNILVEGAMKDLVTRFIEDLTTSKAVGFNINNAVEMGDLAAAKRVIANTLKHGDRYKRLAGTLKGELSDYALEEFGFTNYDESLEEANTTPEMESSVEKMRMGKTLQPEVSPFKAGIPDLSLESEIMSDMQFESWNKQLNTLLTEGLTVSSSTGQQGSPDSVTISATDSDAQELLNIVRKAGLGVFGGGEPDTAEIGHDSALMSLPSDGPEGSGTEPEASPDVVGDGDDMLALIKKMSGLSHEENHAATHDYEEEDSESEEEDSEEDDSSEQDQEDQEETNGEESEEEGKKSEKEVDEGWNDRLSDPDDYESHIERMQDRADDMRKEKKEKSDSPSTPAKSSEKPKNEAYGQADEGNAFTGALAKAKSDGIQKGETMKVGGKTYPVKEDDMEEGNAFTGKLASTPKGGQFELDGKKFKDTSSLEEEALDQPATMEESVCNECGVYESKCQCETVEEAFANDAGQDAMADTELAKLKALLSMGNDLHKMKRDQTVLNPTQVTVRESLNEWKKLSGIK
jgi:hypothetical protein